MHILRERNPKNPSKYSCTKEILKFAPLKSPLLKGLYITSRRRPYNKLITFNYWNMMKTGTSEKMFCDQLISLKSVLNV